MECGMIKQLNECILYQVEGSLSGPDLSGFGFVKMPASGGIFIVVVKTPVESGVLTPRGFKLIKLEFK